MLNLGPGWNLYSLKFRQGFGSGSDVARMWLECGSGVARVGSDLARMWLGRVFGCGRKNLAGVKGKRFPALGQGYLGNMFEGFMFELLGNQGLGFNLK